MPLYIDYKKIFDSATHNPNITLLKKLVVVSYYGNLQINGQLPSATQRLEQYLMARGNCIIDLCALDPVSRHRFEQWLLDPHMNDAQQSYWDGVIASDYRGYTTEVCLSWWGRVLNWIYYRRSSHTWFIEPLVLSFGTQLRSFSVTRAENGLVFGFHIFNPGGLINFSNAVDEEKANNQDNSKRIVLTSRLVNLLCQLDLSKIKADKLLQDTHPLSITVPQYKLAERRNAMEEYRKTELYESNIPWYQRLWSWIISWFIESNAESLAQPQSSQLTQNILVKLWKWVCSPLQWIQPLPIEAPTPEEPKARYSQPLLDADEEERLRLKILYDPRTDKVLVIEQCPPIDTVVYSGGGGKIFAHVGSKRAMEQMDIKCKDFAGSSAGAIMAMLDYLGYHSDEIHHFFRFVSRDLLVHYDIDWTGLSHPRAMKAAFDFAINKKVLELIEHYAIDKTWPGRKFLQDEILSEGKITFRSLHKLKQRYPDCCLGNCIKITATNIKQNRTVIFSVVNTPDMELSEAVKISASMPVIFKSSLLDGEPHSDGGVLRNFPLELFPDRGNTFLSSRYGINLGTIGFCFHTGVEFALLNNFRIPMHRESAFSNWVYSLLTGVKDPATGWQMDLSKVIQNSHQVVVVPADIPSTEFSVSPAQQQSLMRTGFYYAMRHLHHVYDTKTKTMAQAMHANYSSLEELMVHFALRGRQDLFDRLKPFAILQGVSRLRLDRLVHSHFLDKTALVDIFIHPQQREKPTPVDLLQRQSSQHFLYRTALGQMRMYNVLYPIFLRMPVVMFIDDKAFAHFKEARHHLSPRNYTKSLEYLVKHTGQQHFLLYLLQVMMSKAAQLDLSVVCTNIDRIGQCMFTHADRLDMAIWFYPWSLTDKDIDRVMGLMKEQAFHDLMEWMQHHQDKTDTAHLTCTNHADYNDAYIVHGCRKNTLS
ncbi:MAG: patatin-like phospholipase family protein [Legionellaceae bacterium]|nr:patatin-like phospholipase family protein [Legionellaceae bacterium]